VLAKSFKNHPERYFVDGVTTVTVADTRWTRCDIKSIALLPNVLANQAAKDAGAFEALFVRDDILIEGSHSNLFAVIDGVAVTHALCGYILGGITRRLILDRASGAGVQVCEAPIRMSRFDHIQELLLSGTTTEVMPIVRVDGRIIGDGRPGPVTRKLQQAFQQWRSE
jgi:D-alanine transaminase